MGETRYYTTLPGVMRPSRRVAVRVGPTGPHHRKPPFPRAREVEWVQSGGPTPRVIDPAPDLGAGYGKRLARAVNRPRAPTTRTDQGAAALRAAVTRARSTRKLRARADRLRATARDAPDARVRARARKDLRATLAEIDRIREDTPPAPTPTRGTLGGGGVGGDSLADLRL